MVNKDFWLLKINALLHDPPIKPFNIKGHETQASQFAKCLNIKLNKQDFKEADWIASAADRLNFPSYNSNSIGGADFIKKPYLTHPLSGESLNLGSNFLPTQINHAQLSTVMQSSLNSIPSNIKADPKKLYLWLWRNWSDQIQKEQDNQLEVFWNLLPADTRIPDHSIWIHQALTSAIAATNSQPAFLLSTLGPVQSFISAARRTQDLWIGSYLLSYLNWTAIEVIADRLGPDAVIFPNLKGQPLCDRWLLQQGIQPLRPIQQDDLLLPSLPNRFLAIVPASEGAELAKEASEKLRSQWKNITTTVREQIESLYKKPINWPQTWERQTENLFETYWQVYPWLPEGHSIQDKDYKFLDPHKPYLGSRYQKTKNILEVYAKHDKDGGGQYQPNIGAIYSDLYFITEKTLGSRKALRNFNQVDETGEKSTLGGDRAVVYDGIDKQLHLTDNSDIQGRSNIREFWKQLSKKLGANEIQEKGKERLDAVELTKRLAWRFYFQDEFNLTTQENDLGFPSTHSIATASFKSFIIYNLLKGNSELKKHLENWLNQVYPISQGNRCAENIIPYLSDKNQHNDPLINKLLRLDGRLLSEDVYVEKSDDFPSSITLDQKNKAKEALKQLLKFIKSYEQSSPRKYYAVLMMDGDEMGKWLSGEKMPNYQQVLHPDTYNALKARKDWKDILENPRLMSPAIHGFISQALGDFSLKLVRYIVEKRYPGKLVYAGGDDVLALLPVDCVLDVARELRAAFSGEIDTGEIGTNEECQTFDVKFGQQKSGYIWLDVNGKKQLLTTMGHTATASTGIVIAHVTTPLDLVLEEVRKAEKSAKNKEGRNAFSITFLKRSGEIMSAGAKWTYEKKSVDTIELLLKFQKFFADDSISSKFPYVLRKSADIISSLRNKDITLAEIKRLLHRQQGSQKLSQEKEKQLAETFFNLVAHADKQEEQKAKEGKEQGKLKNFADLLIFTHFLATAEGEE